MAGVRGTGGTGEVPGSGGALRHVVVVGASLAGVRAAEALRRRGFDGRLTLVGSETHFPPYDRPPLSKTVLTGGDIDGTRLRVAPGLDAELMLGTTAEGLDLATRTVRLSGGRTLGYDGLVIATGVAARQPVALRNGHPAVFVLRTFDDCLALRAALSRRPRVAVVGGGFIGCEIASSCRSLGLDVTVVEAGSAPLERVLGTAMGRELAALHHDHGTVMATGAPVASLGPDGIMLADGTPVPADVVVVAIGCTPRTEWLRGSGLDIEDGVLLDATCAAVGARRIVAAGDVARWYNPLFGESMRVEHWSNAAEQAVAAAETLLADGQGARPFESVPYFWSDQYDTKIQFVGRGAGVPHIVSGTLAERRFVAVYTDGRHITGALCVNRPSQLGRYRRMVAARTPAWPLLAETTPLVATEAGP